jgi:hypothetical protein
MDTLKSIAVGLIMILVFVGSLTSFILLSPWSLLFVAICFLILVCYKIGNALRQE